LPEQFNGGRGSDRADQGFMVAGVNDVVARNIL